MSYDEARKRREGKLAVSVCAVFPTVPSFLRSAVRCRVKTLTLILTLCTADGDCEISISSSTIDNRQFIVVSLSLSLSLSATEGGRRKAEGAAWPRTESNRIGGFYACRVFVSLRFVCIFRTNRPFASQGKAKGRIVPPPCEYEYELESSSPLPLTREKQNRRKGRRRGEIPIYLSIYLVG